MMPRYLKLAPAVRWGILILISSFGSSGWQTEAFAQVETDPVSVRLKREGKTRVAIEVTGLSQVEALQARVSVWLKSANPKGLPAAAGTLSRGENSIEFLARYGLVPGKEYRVRLTDSASKSKDYFVTVPGTAKLPTKIEAIYPAVEEVPANILKFYVYFSQPMRQGDIYKHIKLLKSDGAEIELPFLEIEQEFWSRDARRLTLLLDPGRVKKGLKPREEMGPIFEPGNDYKLVISGSWEDGNGTPLGADLIKSYRTTEEVNERIDVATWTVETVKANTREPVVLRFGKTLDHAMILRVIKVVNTKGEPVDGEVEAARRSQSIRFVPDNTWPVGDYSFVVDKNLEDLCGNSIAKEFDVDVFKKVEAQSKGESVSIPFTISDK